jgi:hypothetical protein
MKCTNCGAEVPASQINIKTDLAHCKACNTVFKISEATIQQDSLFDVKNNPKGTWYKRVSSQELKLGASTKSPWALFLVPFMLVWSGGSLGGIYGTQITSGEFDPFLSLFGIPFLLGTIIFGSIAAMMVAGKVEITMDKQGGKIFTGLGSIGITKRFQWSDISQIQEIGNTGIGQRGRGMKISLEGSKRLTFGMFLREARRFYIVNALRQVHHNIQNNNTLSF